MSEEELDVLDEREADAEKVELRRLLESVEEENQIAALKQLLQLEPLRDFLWRVISKCGVFDDPMNPNFGNVAYGLGKSAIGKWLMTEINVADPGAWRDMQMKAAKVTAELRRQDAAKKLRRGTRP